MDWNTLLCMRIAVSVNQKGNTVTRRKRCLPWLTQFMHPLDTLGIEKRPAQTITGKFHNPGVDLGTLLWTKYARNLKQIVR